MSLASPLRGLTVGRASINECMQVRTTLAIRKATHSSLSSKGSHTTRARNKAIVHRRRKTTACRQQCFQQPMPTATAYPAQIVKKSR